MNGKVHRRITKNIPPWKQPWQILCFVLAVCAAGWLILHMPAGRTHRAAPAQTTAPATSFQNNYMQHRHSPAKQPIPAQATVSATDRVLSRMGIFGRLFLVVGLAAFLGGVVERRRWYMVLARYMRNLTQTVRLPTIVGIAMPAAICSNAAANSMLAGWHAEGRLSTSALIAGGMINSYLAYVSHSIRVMYPVIGAIGLPGLLYFIIQFTGGLVVICGVLLWNRHHVAKLGQPQKADNKSNFETFEAEPPVPWPQACRQAGMQAATLLFRMVCLTVPLMLGMEWLLKSGALDFWDRHVPEHITRFFPAELLSVVAAQMGGLVQSAAVSANLLAEGLIGNAQILLAMLVASAVGNPIRALRRNIPSALGIFPPIVALIIVLGMQFSRLLITVLAICVLGLCMHSLLY